MRTWRDCPAKPPDYPAGAAAFYRRVAERLMFGARLVANGHECRVTELEAYDYSPRHPDPYAHRHPQQHSPCGWYFHRAGSGYRGGSYKGLDLAIGDAESCTGMLIRGLVLSDGRAVDGPSLCVDAILGLTGCATVRELAGRIEGRAADDAGSLLYFAGAPRLLSGGCAPPECAELEQTPRLVPTRPTRGAHTPRSEIRQPPHQLATGPRVGLSVKTHAAAGWRTSLDYLFRPYRFVRLPRAGKKGTAHLVVGELLPGAADNTAIATKLGLQPRQVARVRAAFDRGRTLPESAVRGLMGTKISDSQYGELSGFWHTVKDSVNSD